MNKTLCILLAMLMLALTACQNEAAVAPESSDEPVLSPTVKPEATAEVPEEEELVEEGPVDTGLRFDAEKSLAEDSESVVYATPREYERKLHSLGFTEYRGDAYRPTLTCGVACLPTGLTYNDEVFRLDFDYLEYADPSDIKNLAAELVPVSGWSLYGMKNAESLGNLTPYEPDDYENADYTDYALIMPEFANNFVSEADYWLYELVDETPTDLVVITEYFYPGSGILYNIVREYEDINSLHDFPLILLRSEEEKQFDGHGYGEIPLGGFELDAGVKLYALDIMFAETPPEAVYEYHLDGIIHSYYEEGMSFIEWRESEYTHHHDWQIVGDSLLYAPVGWDVEAYGTYFLPDASKPISELVTSNEYGTNYIMMSSAEDMGFVIVSPDSDLAIVEP